MKVVVTNLDLYCREVQYFRRNQWKVLPPYGSVEFNVDRNDTLQINYYKSLETCNFRVCFHDDEDKCCACEGLGVQHRDLSEFSDEQLKRIVQNLGISTRVRARWKLESLVNENLPRDTSPSDYLQ